MKRECVKNKTLCEVSARNFVWIEFALFKNEIYGENTF